MRTINDVVRINLHIILFFSVINCYFLDIVVQLVNYDLQKIRSAEHDVILSRINVAGKFGARSG